MRAVHAVSVRLTAGVFDCTDAASYYDEPASLRRLAADTDRALRTRYPDALVSVTWDARTDGRTVYNVTDLEGCEVDAHDVDDVRETCGRVWESWAWAVHASVDGEAV